MGAELWSTPPFEMVIKPFVPDQVAVPLLFRSRKASAIFVEAGKLMPPFAFVVAFVPATQDAPLSAEHMKPPVQVSKPVMAKSPVPASVPPLKVVVPLTELAPLRARVPPVMFSALAKVAAPVMVSGPALKAMVALLLRLAMV